jgi:signal transduction histidine kinase
MRDRIRPMDVALAAAVLVGGQIEVPLFGVPGDPLAAHVLWAVAAVTVLVWRPYPLLFAAIGAAVLWCRYRYGLTPEGGATFAIFGLMSIYGAGAHTRGPLRSVAYATVAASLQILVIALATEEGYGPMVGLPAVEWLGQISLFISAGLGGVVLRDRTGPLEQARRRARELPAEQEAVAAALADERTVVARELQALVTVAVRGALGEIGRARSAAADGARAALDRAQGWSREALAEMRRMLVLLRSPEGAPAEPTAAAAPAPSRDLDALLAWLPAPLRRQGLPLLVLAIGIPEAVWAVGEPPELYGDADLAVRTAGVAAMAAAFVPRRAFPLVSTAAVCGVIVVRVAGLDDFFALNLALYMAAFTAGAYGRSVPTSVLGGVLVVATAVTTPTLVEIPFPAGAYVYIVGTIAAAWIIGYAGRRRLAEADEIHDLAEQDEERNRLAAGRAVAEERLRVARELHDLVGHGLTSITLQCAGAERLVGRDPERAQEAMANASAAAAETLDELGQLLAALGGSETAVRGVDDLESLVEVARTSGLAIDVEQHGDVGILDPGRSAAIYRITQEAITNARKHGAPNRPIRARIETDDQAVRITVDNEVAPEGAPAKPADARSGGHGLIGIQERVRVFEGEVQAGPADPRGNTWRVAASLPLDDPRSAPRVPTSASARPSE